MTLFASISSLGNTSSISKSASMRSYNSSSLQSSNNVQCGGGCGNGGLVPNLVGGLLVTTGALVGTVVGTVGGLVNGLLGTGSCGCN
ncbi:expressed protein [Dictyostelium purpureum]|uniref:Expressed protein n=1 Tax=Dictyostelium purpureum TaxID=5786 RepID=F0ZC61_DICPU|nr:uncharacterized protein DICPUDRAFT_91427 [Dictyostelium purpureum]EGC38468.1 expressed protein [Dictyostelium purpureum]|eukprot:XP_003285026.1 expressed protein [Dictyostelium purpureum]